MKIIGITYKTILLILVSIFCRNFSMDHNINWREIGNRKNATKRQKIFDLDEFTSKHPKSLSNNNNNNEMLKLETSDKIQTTQKYSLFCLSKTLYNCIIDVKTLNDHLMNKQDFGTIPLPMITKKTWDSLIPLLVQLHDNKISTIYRQLSGRNTAMLTNLFLAADYLDIRKSLKEKEVLLSEIIAEKITQKLLIQENLNNVFNSYNYLKKRNLDPLPFHLSNILAQKIIKKIIKIYPNHILNILQISSESDEIQLIRPSKFNSTQSFEKSGNKLLTTDDNDRIWIYDTRTGMQISCDTPPDPDDPSNLNCICARPAFNPRGDKVLIPYRQYLRVLNTSTGNLIKEFEAPGIITAEYYDSTNKIIIVDESSRITILNADTGGKDHSIDPISQYEYCKQAKINSQKNRALIVQKNMENEQKTIFICNLENGQYTSLNEEFNCATFNNKGDKIVTVSLDGTAKIWDTANGQRIKILQGHEGQIISAKFNNTGDKIVTTSDNNATQIWDAQTGQCINILKDNQETITGTIISAKFNNSGDKIITKSDDNTARIWDVQTGLCITILEYHKTINPVLLNRAGDKLAISLDNDKIAIFNLSKLFSSTNHLKNYLTLDQALLLAYWTKAKQQNKPFNIENNDYLKSIFYSINHDSLKQRIHHLNRLLINK